jgi:putative Mg2+ transporter-C (MgtC) family protein
MFDLTHSDARRMLLFPPVNTSRIEALASSCIAQESKANMSIELHWTAIALRLILTIIAGGLLGAERSKTGHVAGLRTTLLVTLAASIAMIKMNLLIPTNGKPFDSYTVMDLMRLPLGILTGVGFIGAGAIVRKDEFILGVTTAATMWFATVVGLCMGGGQLILGSVSTVIGFGVLWGLRNCRKAPRAISACRIEDHGTTRPACASRLAGTTEGSRISSQVFFFH